MMMQAAQSIVLFVILAHVIILGAAAGTGTRQITCSSPTCAAELPTLLSLKPAPGESVVVVGGDEASHSVPVLRLPGLQRVPTSPTTDWQLTLRRVVLLNVELRDPPGASSSSRNRTSSRGPSGPLLWPLNAFGSVGTDLVLQDVRMVINNPAQFRLFLDLLSAQPALQSSVNTTLHTDGRSFVHVTSWSYGSTVLQSVTLMTGPCATQFDHSLAAGQDPTQALAWDNTTHGASGSSLALASTNGGSSSTTTTGCNVFTADNRTLVPLLLDQGLLSSRDMLLVLLQSNISLGHQEHMPAGHIKLGRPVALAGLFTIPTGIDFEMRPNQLDVTAPLARIAFSSLVLENNPTGDVETTLVLAPYSPLATVNMFAVFCHRANASKPCTVLNNVTLVILSQAEIDYIGFMYSMFNSQAPGARQLTLFYAQDLLFTALNFTVGPGPDSITVHNATSLSWRMLDVVYTTSPRIFTPLPLPHPLYVDFEVSKAAPLALQVSNCADLKVALEYRTIPTRFHMLLIRRSFSLAPVTTQQASPILPPPTANTPGLVDGPSSVNITSWPPAEPRPTCLGSRPLVAYRTQLHGLLADEPFVKGALEASVNGSLIPAGIPTLGFAYTRNGLVLPGDQPGQLTFQNLLLEELPQGGTPSELAASAQLPYQLPPEAWTLLMWAVNSTLSARAVRLRNTTVKLPEPEFLHLAALARVSKAFVVELAGHPDALTFKDSSQHSGHLHVGFVEGPGIIGENVTYIADSAAQGKLTRLSTYYWPQEYQPLMEGSSARDRIIAPPSSSRSGASQVATLLPAVLVPVVVLLLLAAVAAALLLRRGHRRQLEQLRCCAQLPPPSQASDKPYGGALTIDPGMSGSQSNLSSSRRSSREGGWRPAHSSCAASASDTGELRVDVEQLMLAAQPASLGQGCSTPPGSGSGWSSPAATAHGAMSPTAHRVRFKGFFPVIEDAPGASHNGSSSLSGIGLQLLPAAAGAGASARGASSGSSSGGGDSSSLGAAPSSRACEAAAGAHTSSSSSRQSLQQPQPQPQFQQLSRNNSPAGLAQAAAAAAAAAGAAAAASTVGSNGSSLASTVACGLEKWRSVVSATTMQLAERRLAGQAASAMTVGGLQSSTAPDLARPAPEPVAAAASLSSSSCLQPGPGNAHCQQQPLQQQQSGGPALPAGATATATAAAAASGSGVIDRPALPSNGSLVLKGVLGRGSFGQVWLGVWRGIPVAVKIMHLATSLLVDPHQGDYQQNDPDQQGQITPPHFAVMEAVLSSQCSHPNVVTVYTYMLSPLLTAVHNSGSSEPRADGSSTTAACQLEGRVPTIVGEPGHGSSAAEVAAAAAAAAANCAASCNATLSGWELQLVQELCDEGTLREALDKGLFKGPGAPFVYPALALLLSRDVAAAMLHLHSEGIVHGDLKSANVMLSTASCDPDGVWASTIGRRLVAKITDFGLAVPLGPTETHASLSARGTPTHMSPELFMAGRVSKACDTYSYGVLLYEIITGQRAFSGIPLPLLPHEVAVKGVRPQWPSDVPPVFRPLQLLAEACWVHEPSDRPVFGEVLDALDQWAAGDAAFHPAWLGPEHPADQQVGGSQQAPALQQAASPRWESPLSQQQQLVAQRQWRQTVRHSSPAVAGTDPEGQQGQLGAASAAAMPVAMPAALPRAGQMDWSEVSFEVAPNVHQA